MQTTNTAKKRYLFFLRHFNDIDNIAPAIYFFLKESPDHRADVILYHEGYDFRNEPNLMFLEKEFPERFSARWLGEYYGIGLESEVAAFAKPKSLHQRIWMQCKQGVKWALASLGLPVGAVTERYRAQRAAVRLCANDIRMGYAETGVIRKGLECILAEHARPCLVVFDVNRSSVLQGLLDNLRALGVKRIICLPVSPLINYNVLRSTKLVDVFTDEFKKLHDYSGFDAIGYVDAHFVDSYNHLLPLIGHDLSLEGRTTSLGSIRFCPEWLSIRESLVPPYGREVLPGKIKLAVLPSLAESNVHWEEFLRCLRLISLFPDYDVVVKAHPRLGGELDLGERSSVTMDNSVDSSALINWADAVLFWSTSVAIEGYMKGKFMVCLSYLVANRNLYEKYDAGYVVKCRDDLLIFLVSFSRNRDVLLYNQEGIQSFLDECIIPRGGTVPERYLGFMRKQEYPTNAGHARNPGN